MSLETLLGAALGLGIVFFLINKMSRKSFGSKSPKKSHLTAANVFTVSASYEAVLEKCKGAIQLFRLKLDRFDPETGTLVALTSVGLLTIGEIITITLTKVGSGVEVKIESTPAIHYLLIDYGRNKKNVAALSQLIQS